MERTFHMLLYRAFHAQRNYLRPCFGRVGLGAGQPKLLVYLNSHGPCRQKELADYFEIDPAAVSRMIDALERGGFVVRRRDESSRRGDLAELTEKGRQAVQAWTEFCAQEEEQMLQGFTPEERQQFADFLVRAYRNLREGKEKERWES